MSTRSIIGVALIVPVAVVIFFIVAGSSHGPAGFREKRAEAECTKASPWLILTVMAVWIWSSIT